MVISVACIVQLQLPSFICLGPAVVLAACAMGLGIWISHSWWCASEYLAICVKDARRSAQTLTVPCSALSFFGVTIVVGNNGEQVVDAMLNLSIDDAVAGGEQFASMMFCLVPPTRSCFSFFCSL